MISRKPDVFTTDQLTALLGLNPKKDKWRVIKFAESREYSIKPAVSEASGPGSRRLYDVENACELALALRILETGLRAKVIGRSIRQLREKGKLSTNLDMEEVELKNLKLVISRVPKAGRPLDETRFQSVVLSTEVERLAKLVNETLRDPIHEYDLILVPLGSTFLGLKQCLAQHRAQANTGD